MSKKHEALHLSKYSNIQFLTTDEKWQNISDQPCVIPRKIHKHLGGGLMQRRGILKMVQV